MPWGSKNYIESLFKPRIQIGPYACVMPHVDLQVAGLHEILFTVWALKRFVFSVVVPKDKKAFPQQRNGLFFLLCVRVYGGSGWPSTWRLVTQGAFESFRVSWLAKCEQREFSICFSHSVHKGMVSLWNVFSGVASKPQGTETPSHSPRNGRLWPLFRVDVHHALMSQKSASVRETPPMYPLM